METTCILHVPANGAPFPTRVAAWRRAAAPGRREDPDTCKRPRHGGGSSLVMLVYELHAILKLYRPSLATSTLIAALRDLDTGADLRKLEPAERRALVECGQMDTRSNSQVMTCTMVGAPRGRWEAWPCGQRAAAGRACSGGGATPRPQLPSRQPAAAAARWQGSMLRAHTAGLPPLPRRRLWPSNCSSANRRRGGCTTWPRGCRA